MRNTVLCISDFNIWWISGCRTLISFEYLDQNKDEQRDGEQFSVQHRQIKLSDWDLTCNNIPSQTSDFFIFFCLRLESFARAPCGSSEDPYNQDASRCKNNSHLLNFWAQTSGSSYLLLSWMLGRRSDAAEHDVDRVKLTFVLLDIKCQAWKLSTRSNQFMLDSRWVAAVNLGTIPEGVPETGRQTDRQTDRPDECKKFGNCSNYC